MGDIQNCKNENSSGKPSRPPPTALHLGRPIARTLSDSLKQETPAKE